MAHKSLIFLNYLKSFSLDEVNLLSEYFGDLDRIFKAKKGDLVLAGLSLKKADKIISFRQSSCVDNELSLADKHGIAIIDINDLRYPSLLKEIPDPPLAIYLKGQDDVLKGLCFGVVGSRLPSIYGIDTAERFSYYLGSLGMVIVSGLARGIDTAAHKGALKGGKTIAVLGSGLLNVYPRQNATLAKDIEKEGALISEFPLREPPLRENFPRRNRIISGISKGVLIVQAALRSGALITARLSLEYNRDVFAVPGNIDSPLSRGPHSLIKDGAKMVESIEDITSDLNIEWNVVEKELKLNGDERKIFDIISDKGSFLEELLSKSDMGRGVISKTVLNLQIRGLIEERKPLYFMRKKI